MRPGPAHDALARAAIGYFLRGVGLDAGFAAGLEAGAALVDGGRLAVRVAPRWRAAADRFRSALSTR